MSDQHEFHKFLIKNFTAFGLGFEGGKKLKLKALNAVPFLTIVLMLTTEYASEIEEKVRMLQIVPLLVLMGFKALIVKTKFASILSLVESTNKMLSDIGENMIIKQSHRKAMKLMTFILFLHLATSALAQIPAFLTHELTIPVWVPVPTYENSFFWLNLLIYNFCDWYAVSLSFAVDALVLYIMMSLKGYSQILKEFDPKSSLDERKRRDSFVKFMNQAYELKM